jgi:ABC-type molybdate transport system substrate-binding protein
MYFACDQSFMTEVTDLFLDAVAVSTNQLVILVHKGNVHGIKSLRDLGKPGLKIGVGHEKQCALGVLTQKTLEEGKLKDPVMKNVQVQLPTGDMLVNQLRVKALDAIIAYVSNATGFHNELEAIAIDIPCAVAVQPIAVGKHSKYPQLAGRLLATIRSQESRAQFLANGFQWQETTIPSPPR